MVLGKYNTKTGLVSAAFFCPQARAPDEEYLDGLRSFLSHNRYGQVLLKEIIALKTDRIWSVFTASREDVAALRHGPEYVDMLHDWAAEGISGPLSRARSGIVALPLLVVLQITQYLRYLAHHGLSHEDFIAGVSKGGGLQGYCGGLPVSVADPLRLLFSSSGLCSILSDLWQSALAIACAQDEEEVVKHAATAIRIVLGVGAYGEAADDTGGTGSTTLAMRLKYEGQGDDLTRRFPGTYVSAITEPRSVSIVGPAATLHELYCFARDQEGLQVQKMEVRGKVHNPENTSLADDLCRLCRETPSLQLPNASHLKVPVRSNKSGQRLLQESLAEELVTTILASRCEWYMLLGEVAKDLEKTRCNQPSFIYFGLTDCVPLTPFHKIGVRPAKTAAHGLIRTQRTGATTAVFPDNALAIVGASCRLPGARNLDELWDLLASGGDRHQKLTTDRFDIHGSFRASQSGSFAKDLTFYGNLIDDVQRFDNSFFGINAREAVNMDPQQRILLELSYEALDEAGYLAKHRREDGDNVGCFIGASFVEYLDNTNAHAPTAYTSTGTIRAFLCGRLSYYYGWSGPAEVIDTACSSSLVAINRACKAVQTGECRMALSGGINIITGMHNYFDLSKAGFLSRTGQCKPFDASADGYCRSDGAGLVVIKKLKHALSDGDPILGVIPGVATNQGGLSASITVPHSAAQQSLYRNVLEQARLSPESVTYVESHGTGTQAGDPLEIESIRSIFRRDLSNTAAGKGSLYVGSIKGNIGHCETAAGVAGLLKVLAMIKYGQIPPQANHKQLNPKIPALEPDGLAIARSLRPWNIPFRAALVNSYGAAGSNCALLCCEFPLPPRPVVIETAPKCGQESPAVPLILSASSEKSLLAHSRALGTYLRKYGQTGMDLVDVAFTLNERRRRLKYCASIEARSIEDAASLLDGLSLSATFTPPQTDSKPVVFLFSGQYDNKVGLDRSFYDSIPIFRFQIDAVDIELKALGYSSIIPAIFDKQPLNDVVMLQCSIFAMQYASAQCWLDAGLCPSAIVGHSLGELTALAVSGVLSLTDALRLVAGRARLIDAKVTPEKGAMLALSSCPVQEYETLASLLRQRQPSAELEVACYNAPNALVVAGSTFAIDAAEALLGAEPRFQKVRVRRLATTHAFHSALMDPILNDLAALAQSLEWREPKIPLEASAPQPVESFKEYKPSNHARDAVFFSEAIRRVEGRLGGSGIVWLEAGVDTPVVPMASKATRQPNAHDFLAMKTQGSIKPADVIAKVTARLWGIGLSASHWCLLPHAKAGYQCKPIWLPPYQFEPTRHWLPNLDRVMEIQKTMSENQPVAMLGAGIAQSPPTPPKLVTKRFSESGSAGGMIVEFLINTQSERFKKIVGGHAVRHRPLCPASMYMECVIMALQLLLDGSEDDPFGRGASLFFENLAISAPLSLGTGNEVVLQLEPQTGGNSWKFTIRTLESRRPTTHAIGVIGVTLNPSLDAFQRLVSGPIERIERLDSDAERLMSKRAYGLFSRVVDYAPFFKAIQSITLSEKEAVASIKLPDGQPGRDETSVWKIGDTVAVDAYIQVVGLLMNSDDSVAADEVVVMVGQDRVIMSPKLQMHDLSECWRVYARFGYGPDQQPIGDVFVCTTKGDLVAIFSGCRFAKLPIPKLEKTLDLAKNGISSPRRPTQPTPTPSSSSSSTTTETTGSVTPGTSVIFPPEGETGESFLALGNMIAEYTGIPVSDLPHDRTLAEMGVDSLASVELVGELSSKFSIDINGEDVGDCTMGKLYRHLSAQSSPPLSRITPTESGFLVPRIEASENPSSSSLSRGRLSSEKRYQKFMQILIEVTGVEASDIKPETQLVDLGVDSLSSIDLKQELEDQLSARLADLSVEDTIQGLMQHLSISRSDPDLEQVEAPHHPRAIPVPSTNKDCDEDTILRENPFDVLGESDAHFDNSASRNGFLRYWSDVAPLQNELMLSYLVEAFTALGVDLSSVSPGDVVPQLPHLRPKHDKVVLRLWEILQNHGFVTIDAAGVIRRGSRAVNDVSSAQLQETFEARFPDYKDEAALIGLTGPNLAGCLSGKLDAVSLMFGGPKSMKIMENYYNSSPMISTLTDQLVVFLTSLLRHAKNTRPVQILEVGAGTGGTTKRLVGALAAAGVSARYTFTDISPSLVAKAKGVLKQHTWIEYMTFNLEKEVPENLLGKFDIVIGTNCVHATSDRTASCRRLRQALLPGGIVILSEVTQPIDWYDIAFGLLDGWWLAEGGTAYPLQPPEKWMSTFAAAGFASASFSRGTTRESVSQQLLVACNKQWDVPLPSPEVNTFTNQEKEHATSHLETMVYKEESGVEVHADVYFPTAMPRSPMQIGTL